MRKGLYFIHLALKAFWKLGAITAVCGRYALGSLLIALVVMIPLNLVLWLLGTNSWGLALSGVLGGLTLIALAIWADINSLTASVLFDQQQNGVPADLQTAEESRQLGLKTMLHFDLVYPSLQPRRWLLDKPVKPVADGRPLPIGQNAWLEGLFLAKPLIALERLPLNGLAPRIHQLLDKNLLRFNPKLIKVQLVTRLVLVINLILGVGVGILVSSAWTSTGMTSIFERLMAGSMGFLSGILISLPGIAFNSGLPMLYHTSIYRWIVNLELGDPTQYQVVVPPILSKVLSR